MKQFPDEIIGYAALDPNYVQDWEKEIQYYHTLHKMRGLKPYYPMMRVPYNDERYDAWYRFGSDHHLFALLHYSDNFVNEVRDIAPRFPNLTLLLAHSGTSWHVARQHVDLAKEFSNIVLEITFTSVIEGIIEYMVKEIGADRVLYGSDAPMRDPYPQFGWVAYANLRETEKKNILGKNMERILAQCRL
jgi:predicted TIM-barrel fold metal-dependent hydrolase